MEPDFLVLPELPVLLLSRLPRLSRLSELPVLSRVSGLSVPDYDNSNLLELYNGWTKFGRNDYPYPRCGSDGSRCVDDHNPAAGWRVWCYSKRARSPTRRRLPHRSNHSYDSSKPCTLRTNARRFRVYGRRPGQWNILVHLCHQPPNKLHGSPSTLPSQWAGSELSGSGDWFSLG